ncbi:hypothetical protein PG990_009560 [Apiospora arundinis]
MASSTTFKYATLDPTVWNQPNPVPIDVILYVDDAIKSILPPGNKIISITQSGSSYWARTANIKTETPDGEEQSFFIKVQCGDYAQKLFASDDPDKFFCLCEFRQLVEDVPDVEVFASMVAEMHNRGISPDGKSSFPVPTYGGRLPMIYPPSDTWEALFTQVMDTTFIVEEESQGVDEDMQALKEAIMTKVIPRLLRPMETGGVGRRLVPRLVHSDLWDGNVAIDVHTNLPVIFDGICLYAHNEYELTPWRPTRHNIGRPYIDAYLRHAGITGPAEDFEDRNLLYCIKFNLNSSAHYPGNLLFRNIVREEMRELVNKYPNGYEGWLEAHPDEAAADTTNGKG